MNNKKLNKKILFLMHIPPPIHGASMVGKIIKESKTLNSVFNSKYINLSLSNNIKEIGKNPFIKIFRYFSILIQCIYSLIFFKPDLCYYTLNSKGIGFYKDIPLVFLIKFFRVKIIYHYHNKGVSDRQNKLFDNLLYQYVLSKSKVILLSKKLYYDIKKYVKEKDVFICANGIPKINQNLKSKLDSRKTFSILFLSNLIKSKGVYVLLDACKILKEKKLNFHCIFIGGVGDISKFSFNEKVNELKLNKYVNYVGKKYKKEKEDAFINSDVFVLPTLNDCFPLVLLEAMQYNLPLISTNEGGISEIIDHKENGFIISKNDPLMLASKLEFLIKNPLIIKKMGNASKQKFKNNFTVEIFEFNINEILKNI